MEKIFYRDIDKDFQNWTASIDGTTVTLPVGSDEIILSLTEWLSILILYFQNKRTIFTTEII